MALTEKMLMSHIESPIHITLRCLRFAETRVYIIVLNVSSVSSSLLTAILMPPSSLLLLNLMSYFLRPWRFLFAFGDLRSIM